jgi:hypothetical protein
MNQLPPALARRLLYILHRGLVQTRNLALSHGDKQIADLADTLELLPSLMDRWEDEHLPLIRSILETYQKEFPGGGYDYLQYLEQCDPPERF